MCSLVWLRESYLGNDKAIYTKNWPTQDQKPVRMLIGWSKQEKFPYALKRLFRDTAI